jgi:hypothetical protein
VGELVVLLGLIDQVHRIDRLRRLGARTRPRGSVLAKERWQDEHENCEDQNEWQEALKVRRHSEHDTPQPPRDQRPRFPPPGAATRRVVHFSITDPGAVSGCRHVELHEAAH